MLVLTAEIKPQGFNSELKLVSNKILATRAAATSEEGQTMRAKTDEAELL